MRDSRKKISKDTIVTWIIDGKVAKKSLNERLEEVRSQANQKIREDDHILSIGYGTKMDGSLRESARVEKKRELKTNSDVDVESYLADKYGVTEKVFKNFKHFLSGGNGNLLRINNMGYIGNHPNLLKIEEAEQEKIKLKKIEIAQRDKEIAQREKLIDLEERKTKLAEQGKTENDTLVTELCDQITRLAMQAQVQAQPSKGKKKIKKPKPKEMLTESYELWAESNLEPETKKQYFKDQIRNDWEVSDEYGKWLEDLEAHGLYEPAESQLIKVYSETHTKLKINIHQGNLFLNEKKP